MYASPQRIARRIALTAGRTARTGYRPNTRNGGRSRVRRPIRISSGETPESTRTCAGRNARTERMCHTPLPY